MTGKRIRVAVLFGGVSSEHEVAVCTVVVVSTIVGILGGIFWRPIAVLGGADPFHQYM